MKTTKWMTAALAGLLMAAGTGTALALDPDEANTIDGLTVRITPNADYGVTIDTTNVFLSAGAIDLGALSLYQSTYTALPATVTIVGTVSKNPGNNQGGQELDVKADILTTNGWTFDPTPTTDQTSGSIDELAMFLLFTEATDAQGSPTGAEYTGAGAAAEVTSGGTSTQNSLTYRAGGLGGAGSKFEFGGVDMDKMSVGNKRHMWMYFRLPSETSTGSAQEIAVTLTATGTSL